MRILLLLSQGSLGETYRGSLFGFYIFPATFTRWTFSPFFPQGKVQPLNILPTQCTDQCNGMDEREKMESGKYGGRKRWLLMNPPSGNSKPMGTSLLGHPVIPPRYGQVDRYKIQIPVRNKKNKMHIFKGFEDQSDT